MKKVLISLIVLLFAITLGISQKSYNNIQYLNSISSQLIKNLKINPILESNLDIEGKICLENWDLDTLDVLAKSGGGTITFESLSGNRYLITQEWDTDGEELLFTGYFRNRPDFLNTKIILDSTQLYLVDGEENILYTKTLYTYKDNNLVYNETQTNYAIFDPDLGLITTEFNRYYYDNNNFLTSEALYSFDYATSSLTFSDSTVYINNSNGLPKESYYYEIGYDGVFGLSKKHTYTYNSDALITKEEVYSEPSDWQIEERHTTTYTSSFTVELSEYTWDNGTTWNHSNRDSTYFDNMPFNYFSRLVSESYEEDSWKTNSISIATNCGGNFTQDLEELSFSANFIDNEISIFSDKLMSNSTITLYNANGQIIYKQYFQIVPNKIRINNITSGMYFIEVRGSDLRGIKKLIKS